jgi:hypothetical protein
MIKLVTRLRPGCRIDGYVHHDERESSVRAFFKKIGLQYPDSFVCIFLYKEPECHIDPDLFGYGEPYRLNPLTVPPDITIACSWDIQNAACGAMRQQRNRRGFEQYRGMMRTWPDVAGIRGNEPELRRKEAELVQVLGRLHARYAEARMCRPLRAEDVLDRLSDRVPRTPRGI